MLVVPSRTPPHWTAAKNAPKAVDEGPPPKPLPAPPSDEDALEARRLKDEGNAHTLKGEHAEASRSTRELFLDATQKTFFETMRVSFNSWRRGGRFERCE